MNKNPQYFEGVLQLRNPTEEILDFVDKAIKKDENVWIAKKKEQKNGIDLYLSSNKFLKAIAKKLKNSFSGELIETSTLFSRNRLTQKELRRGCILFRYYKVKRGDIITVRSEKYKVISIGKDILVKNLKSNVKSRMNFSNLD